MLKCEALGSADAAIGFCINNTRVASLPVWTTNGDVNRNEESFSIFLSSGDKIYFNAYATNTATNRALEGHCYPMF